MELQFLAMVHSWICTEPEVRWWYVWTAEEVERKGSTAVRYLIHLMLPRQYTLECTQQALVSGYRSSIVILAVLTLQKAISITWRYVLHIASWVTVKSRSVGCSGKLRHRTCSTKYTGSHRNKYCTSHTNWYTHSKRVTTVQTWMSSERVLGTEIPVIKETSQMPH